VSRTKRAVHVLVLLAACALLLQWAVTG